MVELDFAKAADGLLPAIAQDAVSGEILMLAYINEEAWEKTLATGKAHYWSRSRGTLWLKGESSGHVQLIREILYLSGYNELSHSQADQKALKQKQ